MKTMKRTATVLGSPEKPFASYTEEFSRLIAEAAGGASGAALCINPRDGGMLHPLIDKGAVIDSFVSDEEWIEAASAFSRNVFSGCSHRPLLKIAPESCNAVIVCEDFAFVDDVDAMFNEYFRLLTPGGALLGLLWNISYAGNIDRLLNAEAISREGKLCGNSLIPIDSLMSRLGELGFQCADVYSVLGDREDAAMYAEVSMHNLEPVPAQAFNTQMYLLRVWK